jgi:hypothetical protein
MRQVASKDFALLFDPRRGILAGIVRVAWKDELSAARFLAERTTP